MAFADAAAATMLEHAVIVLALAVMAVLGMGGFVLWGWGKQLRRANRTQKRLATERRRNAYLRERLDETEAELVDARWRLHDEQTWLDQQLTWTPRAWRAFGPDVPVNGDAPGAEL